MIARHDGLDTALAIGLTNDVTGLGHPDFDTRARTRRCPRGQPDVYVLDEEYLGNWMARRECDDIPAAAFGPGFNLTNVKPPNLDVSGVQSLLEGELAIKPADGSIDRQRGLTWYARSVTAVGNRLGGAILLSIVQDGLDPISPLDTRRIQRVVGWEVLDRSEVTPWSSSGASEPDYYMLNSVLSSSVGSDLRPGQVFHASRCWVNHGVELTRREMRNRGWWGASVLELNWQWRRGAEEAANYLLSYADRASWLHMQIAGLDELLQAKDPDTGERIGDTLVGHRMRQFRTSTRTLGIAVTDGGRPAEELDGEIKIAARHADKIESLSESVGDLPEIEQRAREWWQAGWGAPKSIAFGDGPTGIRGGDNVGDWNVWESMRMAALNDGGGIELVNWMLTICFAAKQGPTGGVIPSWTLEPKPLRKATRAEKIKEQRDLADADGARINQRVVSAKEVRQQRIVQGDTEGQLRAMEVIEEDQTIQPKAVGVVTGLLDAGKAVFQNEMSPEYMAWVLPVVDPSITPAQALVGSAAAAAGKPEPLPTATAPVPGAPGQAAPADGADVVTDDEVGLFSSDPIPPGGLMTARAIKDRLRAEGFLGMTTQRITKLAKLKLIRVWDQLGPEPGFSLDEVVAELAKRNGKAPAEGEDDVALEADDTEEGRADSLFASLVGSRWWVRWQPAPPPN